MQNLKQFDVWFITGSQHLYGPETLDQVAENSRQVVAGLNASGHIPVNIVFKPVLTTPDAIRNLCLEANSSTNCVGLVTWMHTFSPAKMWIAGVNLLKKPFLHLHTQFNREIPWSDIDMDFMNLNQSAHGDREFGFICTRMGLNRKVVVGHWMDSDVQESLGTWARAVCAWHDAQGMKIARFGDNMSDVAKTVWIALQMGHQMKSQKKILSDSIHGTQMCMGNKCTSSKKTSSTEFCGYEKMRQI